MPRAEMGRARHESTAIRDEDDDTPSRVPGRGGAEPEPAGGVPGRDGASEALPSTLRARMERAFGFDLGGVRVGHSAGVDELGARAFAHGDQLWFAPGAYDPNSAEGMLLIAHEIAHLIQQSVGRASGTAAAGDGGLEAEADAMAARAVRGEPANDRAPGAPLKTLAPASGGALQLKLKIGSTWHRRVPPRNATKMLDQWGFSEEVVDVLRQWAADDKRTPDRIYATWREAAEAAQRAQGPDGGGWSWGQIMILLFVVLLIFMPMVTPLLGRMLHPSYEVRSNLEDTARVVRRPLEPLLPVAQRAQNGTLTVENLVAEIGTIGGMSPMMVEGLMTQVPPPLLQIAQQHVGEISDGMIPHALTNPCGTGLFHEHIFLSNGTNVGSFDDGMHGDRPDLHSHYEPNTTRYYDSELMGKSVEKVGGRHQPYKGLTDNCQDYVSDVVDTYGQMGGREIVPTETDAYLLTPCDVLTGRSYGRAYLDRQVDEALTERLTSEGPPVIDMPMTMTHTTDITLGQRLSPQQSGSSEPKTVPTTIDGVAQLLGVTPELFGASIDDVLDRPVVIHEEGTTTVRKLVCEPKSTKCPSVLEGALNEVVFKAAKQDIIDKLPGLIRNNERAQNYMVSYLSQRITNNLMGRFKLLRELCGPEPSEPPVVVTPTVERPTHTTHVDPQKNG